MVVVIAAGLGTVQATSQRRFGKPPRTSGWSSSSLPVAENASTILPSSRMAAGEASLGEIKKHFLDKPTFVRVIGVNH